MTVTLQNSILNSEESIIYLAMKESQCCRMKAMEDEYHFVMICPAYRHLHLRYLLKYYCSRLNISKYVLLYHLVQDLCYLNFVIYLMIIGSYGHSCLHNLLLIIYIYLYLFTFFIHIVDYLFVCYWFYNIFLNIDAIKLSI